MQLQRQCSTLRASPLPPATCAGLPGAFLVRLTAHWSSCLGLDYLHQGGWLRAFPCASALSRYDSMVLTADPVDDTW